MLAITLALTSFAQDEFMGIKIEGPKSEIIAAFKQKGFTLTENAGNIVVMEGTIAGGTSVELDLAFTPISQVCWKLLIYLPKQLSWPSILKQYEDYKKTLTDKYGKPSDDYSFFTSPYYEGDGYEMTALAIEKCHYTAFWNDKLVIEMSTSKRVYIAYENPVNGNIYTREKEQLKAKTF